MRVQVLEHQAELLTTTAPFYGLIGGRGSAKTRGGAILVHHAWLCRYPHIPFAVVADTFAKLSTNFFEELIAYYDHLGLEEGRDYSYRRSSPLKIVYKATGASLTGYSMEKPPERTKGPTVGGVLWDEADQIGEQHFQIFSACARDPRGPCQNIVLSNPGPPAHWTNRLFSGSTAMPGAELRRVTTYDNKFLTPGYIAHLESMYPPGTPMHERWMLGKNVPMTGAVYPQFMADTHVVESHPPLVAYVAGLDLGIADPSVLLIGGITQDGVLYIVDEYRSAPGDPPQVQAVSMKRTLEKYGNPPIYSDHSLTFTTALRYEGVHTINAEKDRGLGIAMVTKRLANGFLYIVKNAAPGLEEEMQLYRWKDLKGSDGQVKDITEHTWSHGPDSARYMIVGIDGASHLRLKL
jgi:hypothetical protein